MLFFKTLTKQEKLNILNFKLKYNHLEHTFFK